jgi:hypothetical protein
VFNELLGDIANRFQTWLQASNTGTLVTNNRKDYINRAQRWLQNERVWDDQVRATSLTVSSGYASLPSDMVSLVAVAWDQDSDGKPEWYYYRDGDQGRGYRIVPTHTKAAGTSWQIQMFTGWPYTPNMCLYQKKLEDFEDTGTEYSFFPGELLLRVAQLIRQEEYNPKDYAVIKLSVKDLLKKYKGMQYQNPSMKRDVLDNNGNKIVLESQSLNGRTTVTSFRENGMDS